MSTKDKVTLFYKAGYDDKCFGACYQSQRVLILSELKFSKHLMPEFTCIPVNISRPPDSFQRLGLRLRVPALHIQNELDDKIEPIDVADDIVSNLQSRFPGGVISNHWEAQAENVTSNFFSKFCYLIRGIAKDSQHLEQELSLIDEHLSNVASESDDDTGLLFLCGNQMSLIDCEVLPKLHQVRVAAASLKGKLFTFSKLL
ncbi:chloride intracellular channel protein 2 [Nilaparvata lugens]|uniref:chloride intracellular channel protein 2 n=1 Tax=Nilaparvata lugens TaxID=108931 RepID=UPI00193D374F|nr:chloride intracellular channel protein 2 [Nilaparvata lugens]